ncbi:unnamed protein product [Merluccius merluccius]
MAAHEAETLFVKIPESLVVNVPPSKCSISEKKSRLCHLGLVICGIKSVSLNEPGKQITALYSDRRTVARPVLHEDRGTAYTVPTPSETKSASDKGKDAFVLVSDGGGTVVGALGALS